MLAAMDQGADLSSLRIAVSAGETLPAPVFEEWTRKTGKPILDGIGATEMLHIFISNRLDDMAPATHRQAGDRLRGKDRRRRHEGAAARHGRPAGRARPDRLPLPGRRPPAKYVRDGWNLTGDSFVQDEDGFFHFAARSDDMIISSGYNIAGPEVEAALLAHAHVKECAVIGVADVERGQIVEAHVVLVEGVAADDLTRQDPAGPRQGDDRALQISALGEVHRRAAEDADRQDPALPAERART